MIEKEKYLDKIHGGWFGKCLGGAAGAPVEGFKRLIETKHYTETLRTDLPNDDLDLQLLWLELLQKKGFTLTAEDLAEAWDMQCWYPFNEYGIFLKNHDRKIAPPYSGSFNNPIFCEAQGSPIRSEIWGMCFPGRPKLAAAYAAMDSSLDHAGESLWIEQYYAAVEAVAFEQSDMVRLLTESLDWLPESSRARGCAKLVLERYAVDKTDWQRTRTLMLRQYANNDFSNSVTNLGLTMIALLYGNGSLDDVVNIAYRSGYDADCTCATAGAIMGIVLGYSGIGDYFRRMVQDTFVVGIDVKRENNSIALLAQETAELGLRAMEEVKGDIPAKASLFTIGVHYLDQPAIGIGDTVEVELVLDNATSQIITDTLLLTCNEDGVSIEPESVQVYIAAGQKQCVRCCVSVLPHTKEIPSAVVCTAICAGVRKDFGLAGAMVYRAFGPFFDQLEKKDKPGLPPPHPPGCNLPNLECMMNNFVTLDKDYPVEKDDFVIINAYEDMLPLDEAFAYRGQGCLYLDQTLISPEERDVWIVISNNDGFAYWLNDELLFKKDETRLYTPYNNYGIVHLRKGENKVRIQLLKRTDTLKFGLNYRAYGGQHFNRTRWLTDLSTRL